MCVEACPEDAIDMTNNIDLVAITREAMIWDKDRLLANFDDSKDQKGTLGQSLRGGQVSFTRPRGQALLPDKDGH